MDFAHTIALAHTLLAEGRGDDVLRMLAPLLDEADGTEPGAVQLRALAARVHATHTGDLDQALALLSEFDRPGPRTVLPAAIHAEVTLWLGWAHARRSTSLDEAARALALLDEAHRYVDPDVQADARGWILLGRAHAYLASDEFALMRAVLDEAQESAAIARDALAQQWLHDLYVPALRTAGAYEAAQTHADALRAQANAENDRALCGRALAHQAALALDRGAPPETLIETATEAERLLASTEPGHQDALLNAYNAHIRALLRQQHKSEAEATLTAAREALPSSAEALLQMLRARLLCDQGHHAAARDMLEEHLLQQKTLPPGWCDGHIALLRGRLQLLNEDDSASAQPWGTRALTRARETGHCALQLAAHLLLAETALAQDDVQTAAAHLDDADALRPLLRALPHAAQYHTLRAAQAQQAKQPARAWVHAAYARAARTRMGTAETDLALQGNAFPNEVSCSFERLAGAMLAEPAPQPTLLLDAWLRAIRHSHPTGWLGIAVRDEAKNWHIDTEQGERPAPLTFPPLDDDGSSSSPVRWLPVSDAPVRRMGIANPADVSPSVSDCVEPWLPALAAALKRPALEPHPANAAPSIFADFIAENPAMQQLTTALRRRQHSHTPALICGERGTGKATIGRMLHALSPYRDGACHVLDCAGIAPDPLSTRLFGTDAQPGFIDEARGGTLLLQAIEALPLTMQDRLLRVLQQETRAASTPPTRARFRLIATTTTDLDQAVQNGTFREALQHRLSMNRFDVPPLRQRRSDIPLLTRHFLDTLRPSNTPSVTMTPRAMHALVTHDWPGNVRQLRNELARALAFIRSEPAPVIDATLLSTPLQAPSPSRPAARIEGMDAIFRPDQDLSEMLAHAERQIIEHVLAACHGQITASADMLGLTRQGLYKKMKRLAIDASPFQTETASEPAPSSS